MVFHVVQLLSKSVQPFGRDGIPKVKNATIL